MPLAAVILGRVYRWKKNDLSKGVEILTDAANEMKAKGISSVGFATVLYNKACYNTLLGKDKPANERKSHLEQ